MTEELGRIIVARTDRIGDVVLALPVFATLKRRFPGCKLTALVRDYTADVVSSFPDVDDILTFRPDESIAALSSRFANIRPDALLVLFPRFKIAAAAFMARIPLRIGTAYRSYSFLFNRRVKLHRKYSTKSEAEYNLDLAAAAGCKERVMKIRLNVDKAARASVERFLGEKGIDDYFVVHPGSGGSATDWTGERFHELIKSIVSKRGAKVIVTGLGTEIELCRGVCEGIDGAINAAGKFSLLEFIALLSSAKLFVSNSTGPIHLAAAVGTPVVGIYPNTKPMTPVRWSPITERKSIITPKDGSNDLSTISVEEVEASIAVLVLTGNK